MSPNSECSFPTPLSPPKSPTHTAILRKQGKADSTSLVGKGPGDPLVVSLIHLQVPVLPLIYGALVIYVPDLTAIEPIKVDLEALAQAQWERP